MGLSPLVAPKPTRDALRLPNVALSHWGSQLVDAIRPVVPTPLACLFAQGYTAEK